MLLNRDLWTVSIGGGGFKKLFSHLWVPTLNLER